MEQAYLEFIKKCILKKIPLEITHGTIARSTEGVYCEAYYPLLTDHYLQSAPTKSMFDMLDEPKLKKVKLDYLGPEL